MHSARSWTGALVGVASEKSLSDLLDGAGESGAGDGHLVDE